MAYITESAMGGALQSILMADDIVPGSDPSYELCKAIYLYHPLGMKIIERPIQIAMSKPRELVIHADAEDMLKEAFKREWLALDLDRTVFNLKRISRIYGISALVYGAPDIPTSEPISPNELPELDIYFHVFDPLNTAGSLIFNQLPNSPDFQKPTTVAVQGSVYHRSRSCVVLNEDPIYISFTSSAFGFVGRSAYQRCLYPLKSFIQSMITDEMVTRKAGVMVAKTVQPGTWADSVISKFMNVKRNLIKESKTDQVINISPEESIETLDMNNADTAMTVARRNILENCAAGADLPAKLLNAESFAEGFGEGVEDAKDVIRCCQRIRDELDPIYAFLEPIVMRRAWSPAFFERVKQEYPQYQKMSYNEAFYSFQQAFTATWPNLMQEPDSERIKVQEIQLRAGLSLVQELNPQLDAKNKAAMIQWLVSNYNGLKLLFPQVLDLDEKTMLAYLKEQARVAEQTQAMDLKTEREQTTASSRGKSTPGGNPSNGAKAPKSETGDRRSGLKMKPVTWSTT